jgi:hypothetical protein
MNRYSKVVAATAVTLSLVALASSCATTGDVDTTPTAGLKVDAHVGKTWNSDSSRIENISDNFMANETVLAVVDVPGDASGTLRVRWMYGNETVSEQTITTQTGQRTYAFRLSPGAGLRTGDYKFEAWLNGELRDSENFKVG